MQVKIRDLRPGDVVVQRHDIKYGKTGTVSRIKSRGGNSPVRDVYFDQSRQPCKIHGMVCVEIANNSLTGKGFKPRS